MLEYLDIAIGFATVMLLLSLLVTAIVQAISTLLDLRGRNLVWALAKLFDQVLPDAEGDAQGRRKASKELAEAVASHPWIAPSARFKAKAIRLEELRRILGRLASTGELRAAKKGLEALKANGALSTRAAIVGDELGTWFDGVMVRSSDRFARTSKFWSAGIAAVLAFGLQVDAIAILGQISSNAGVRNELVAMSQPAIEHAKQMEDFANLAGKTFADLKQQEAFKDALKDAPAAMGRCADGQAWIAAHPAAANAPGLAAEFTKQCGANGVAALGTLPERVQGLEQTLSGTTLEVFGRWKRAGDRYWQVLGLLMTVAFLTLGGPFWFNLLQQMASLRPTLARKMAAEKAAGEPAAATEKV